MKYIIKRVSCFFILFFLTSCTTVTPPASPPQFLPQPPVIKPQLQPVVPPLRNTIYHTAAPLETVWRLSKMYDVSVESILRANNLSKDASIQKGQKLLIPHAAPLKAVIPLYPSRKWKHIIVHHSATEAGNALAFDAAHNRRGWEGLGYHFVIDNGTAGKQDGQIEVSPRWIKQQDGAHCKASNMNTKSIGICLVGNFNYDKMTRRQMDSLVYLTNTLRRYYGIPKGKIHGHGQVTGAKTDCPGKRFPWNEYIKKL